MPGTHVGQRVGPGGRLGGVGELDRLARDRVVGVRGQLDRTVAETDRVVDRVVRQALDRHPCRCPGHFGRPVQQGVAGGEFVRRQGQRVAIHRR